MTPHSATAARIAGKSPYPPRPKLCMDASFQTVSPITLSAPIPPLSYPSQHCGRSLHGGNNLCGLCAFFTSVFMSSECVLGRFTAVCVRVRAHACVGTRARAFVLLTRCSPSSWSRASPPAPAAGAEPGYWRCGGQRC